MGAGTITIEFDARDAPLHGATPWRALGRFLSHGFRIRGRASRSEYWWWMLAQAIVSVGLVAVVPALHGYGANPVSLSLAGPFGVFPVLEASERVGDTPMAVVIANMLALALALGTLIPAVTVAVRRLHDANFSGLWVLLGLVPLGVLALALMLARGSREAGERFDC